MQYQFEGNGKDTGQILPAVNGTLLADARTEFIQGKGYALELTNSDDYMDCGSAAKTSFNSSLTLMAWVKTGNPGYWATVAGRGNPNNVYDAAWHIMIPGAARFELSGVGTVYGTTVLADNSWHHIAGVFDKAAGKVRIYIDGILENTANASGTIASRPEYLFSIGSLAGKLPYRGLIDDVMLYNEALAQPAIAAIVQMTRPLDLAARYQLNTNAADSGELSPPANGLFRGGAYLLGEGTIKYPSDTGQVLVLDGINDDLYCGVHAKLGSFGSMTVSAWIKTSGGYWPTIVGRGNPNNVYDSAWHLMAPGRVRWQIPYIGEVYSTTSVTNNQWYHLLGVYDGKNKIIAIYINGVLENSASTSGTLSINTNYEMTIGSLAGNQPFAGYIDDVCLWSRALSAAEAQQIYTEGVSIQKTYAPAPADGAIDQPSALTLQWKASPAAASYQVYLGTDLNRLRQANASSAEYMGTATAPVMVVSSLQQSRIYYWRVDEIVSSDVHRGNVWLFKVADMKAQEPVPSSGSAQIYPYHTIGWKAGLYADSHDVYLGTSLQAVADASPSSPEYQGRQIHTTFDISALSLGEITYYWRIDEISDTDVSKGTVWSFTTAPLPVITGQIAAIEMMPNKPSPYVMRNWKQVARDYDTLLFNFDAAGDYLPLVCWDTRGYNTGWTMFAVRGGYVGGYYAGCSATGAEQISTAISAALCGLDKSQQWCANTQSYQNYVLQLENYWDPAGQVYAYNCQGSLNGAGWYISYSSQLFTELYWLYDSGYFQGNMTGNHFASQFQQQSEQWFQAGQAWGGVLSPWKVPTDIPKGIYFPTMTVANDWVSDMPAGYAWIMYMAYAKLRDPRYLAAAEWGLEALLRNSVNPGKESDIFYAPITAARINAETGRQYDLQKLFEWCMGPNHSNGWGVICKNGKAVNGYDCYGLAGADWTNIGGFSVNTFIAFHNLVPVARYDDRFARSIGKYALNCANAARLFYGGFLPESHSYPSDIGWINMYDPQRCMPTEILRTRGLRQQRAQTDYNLIYGTIVEGSYQSTHGRLGPTEYEVLEEKTVGDYDALEHIWNVNVEPAYNGRYSLNVTANVQDGGDGDGGFKFSWATNPAGPFEALFTMASSGGKAGDFTLHITSPTIIYIKVEDTNRVNGNTLLDRISIDNLFVWQECQWGPEPSGDAVPAGWGPTNLAPYCAHLSGYLGAVVETTNVEGVLQLDLLATDVFHASDAYPTYLYYNPYTTPQTVQIDVGVEPVDVYDAVSGTFLKTDATGQTSFLISPDSAVIVVLAPANGLMTYNLSQGLQQTLINGVVVDYVTDGFGNLMRQHYTGTRNNMTGRLGYTFEPVADFRINALGRSVNPSVNQGRLLNSHTIELFDVDNGVLLAAASVDAASPKDALGYAFVSLTSPVELHAGRKYMILSSETSGDGDLWMDYSVMNSYCWHLITILGGEFAYSEPGSGMPAPGYSYFGNHIGYVPPTMSVAGERVMMDQFYRLAVCWLDVCSFDNNWCHGADINFSGRVDLTDLVYFIDVLWLR